MARNTGLVALVSRGLDYNSREILSHSSLTLTQKAGRPKCFNIHDQVVVGHVGGSKN